MQQEALKGLGLMMLITNNKSIYKDIYFDNVTHINVLYRQTMLFAIYLNKKNIVLYVLGKKKLQKV